MPRLKLRALMQNPEIYSLPILFLEVAYLVLGKRKNAAHNRSYNLPIFVTMTCLLKKKRFKG